MFEPTLTERIEALENRKLKLDDLPIADIIRKIELIGLDASTLPAALVGTGGQAIEIRWGLGTVVFTASTFTPFVAVNHNIGRVPAFAVAQSLGAAVPMNFQTSTNATATFRGEYWTALTGSFQFCWIAIG